MQTAAQRFNLPFTFQILTRPTGHENLERQVPPDPNLIRPDIEFIRRNIVPQLQIMSFDQIVYRFLPDSGLDLFQNPIDRTHRRGPV